MKSTAVLLAAGQGTRMKSDQPKVLFSIAGWPLIRYALVSAKDASSEKPVVVVGHGAEAVQDYIGDSARCVLQEPQLGTGHAVQQSELILRGKTDYVLVSYADMPLLRGKTLKRLVDTQVRNSGPITILTVQADDPRGFGRILRKTDGTVRAIVEETQATTEERLIRELNVGAYCFAAAWLWDALKRIPLSPKGEYFLTDTIGLAVADNLPVEAIMVDNPAEVIGINTRVHLAEAETLMRRHINQTCMSAGVTMIDPQSTYIEAGVTIGRDTVIWPNTYLQGYTQIGRRCNIGPNTIVRDTKIGSNCKVLASVLEGAILEDNVEMGPFAHLRKGAHLARGVHMGNFGEVKDSYLGPGVKMGHFSYIGDARVGAETNIGAGTITCNYDGEKKHSTEIGEKVFIGSDTMLVAPLKVGKRARTGAGSVVTKDVPPDTLVVGMPARAVRKSEKHDGG